LLGHGIHAVAVLWHEVIGIIFMVILNSGILNFWCGIEFCPNIGVVKRWVNLMNFFRFSNGHTLQSDGGISVLFGQVLSDLLFLNFLLFLFVSQLVDSVVECVGMILSSLEGNAIVEFIQIDGVHFGISFLGFLIFFDFVHLVAKFVGSDVHLGFPEVGVVLINIVTSFKSDEFIELFHVLGL